MRVHGHDPLDVAAARQGAALAYGRPLWTLPRLGDADVVVSLDADPLGPGPMQIAFARGFAERRRNVDAGRLYVAQSSPSVTAASADRRIVLAPAGIAELAAFLARAFGADLPQPDLTAEATAFARDVAADLDAHKARALVLAGPALPPDIHALCAWINGQLRAPLDLYDADDMAEAGLAELTDDLRAGKVGALFILGCNPAYDASPEIGFEQAVAKAKLRVHLGLYDDETSRLCEWRVAETHALESWSDGVAPDGSASLAQPLIAPLYDTRSAHQILAALDADPKATDHDLVRANLARAGARRRFRELLAKGAA